MKIEKARHIVLLCAVGVLLCSVLGTRVALLAGASFPEWSGVGDEVSQLEGRTYEKFVRPGPRRFVHKTFQKRLEPYLSDHVLLRNQVILANAAVQRSSIALANLPFGFDAYHTKYASRFVVAENRAVLRQVRAPSRENLWAAHKLADAVNACAAAHPGTVFAFDLVDDTYTTAANPTAALSSHFVDQAWIDEHLVSRLDERVRLRYERIESAEELYTDWFCTEHHWKLSRALESYNGLAEELGWKPAVYAHDFEVVPAWVGASARGGVDLDYRDSLRDVPDDFSFLQCRINGGEPCDRGLRGPLMRGQEASVNLYNAYHSYFGGPRASVAYENSLPGASGCCLFVEMSHGVAVEPYIAQNFARCYCVNPFSFEVTSSLDDLVGEYDPDVVVVQVNAVDIARLADRSPRFVGADTADLP